ncbi:zinc ribbon domain-containing protein [Methanolobus sp. ZRKC3]|uniref:zinc ribbon domain-containing protein n=1 Tax=Methanolobus sp. ZRKC3 TaxID=3125786 RepID=UPI00324DD609
MNVRGMEKTVFCQSCGMPLQCGDDLGINVDGTKNEEYCTYCYYKGEFTEPDITIEEMINKYSRIMQEIGSISQEDAKRISMQTIPQLKRWR